MLDIIFKLLSGIGGNKNKFEFESDHESGSSSFGEMIRKCATSEMRKRDGSIDHRGHSGNDRTPAQKAGDRARRK